MFGLTAALSKCSSQHHLLALQGIDKPGVEQQVPTGGRQGDGSTEQGVGGGGGGCGVQGVVVAQPNMQHTFTTGKCKLPDRLVTA